MGFLYNRRLLPEYNVTTVYCCFVSPTPVDDEKTQHISPLVIIIVAILGGCFLLVSYYAIIVKYCSNLNSRRRTQPRIQEDPDTHEDFLDENHGPVVDHPVWYIHTVGLSQSVIDSIGVFEYKKGDGLVDGSDCAVCLSEFEDGDALRLLPKCTHAFHLSCIDTWLSSHTNCPSCRAPIVASPIVYPSTGIASNPDSSSTGEETQVENSASDGGLGNDENGDPVSELGVEGQDVEEEQDRRRDIEIPKKVVLSPSEMAEVGVRSDLSDNHRVVQIRRQSVRRSASMDFHPASIFCFSVGNMLPLEEDEGSSVTTSQNGKKESMSPALSRVMGSSLKEGLSRSPLSMKRSFSSGGKLTLSRSSQSRSSILPL